MSSSGKIYDHAFKTGAGLTFVVFIALNSHNCRSDRPEISFGISDSSSAPPLAGFPFAMPYGYLQDWLPAFVANVFVLIASCFAVGFIFQVTWSEFRRSRESKKSRK